MTSRIYKARHALPPLVLACWRAASAAERRQRATAVSSPSARPPARRSAGSSSAPRHPRECEAQPIAPRDVVLTTKAWADLVRINKWVNDDVKPMTDLDHWGVVEKWSYPDDGYGDCEDYVLLKRRMLIEAGWPREALLITVVRERTATATPCSR